MRATDGGTRDQTSGLVSVIVPCRGQLPYTRMCLAALARHTRPPWELVAVARDDLATTSYLAGVRDAAAVPVTILAEPLCIREGCGCDT